MSHPRQELQNKIKECRALLEVPQFQVLIKLLDLYIDESKERLVNASPEDVAALQGAARKLIEIRRALTQTPSAP